MKQLNAQQTLELQERVRRYFSRSQSYALLMKKLDWKRTGGHPDQHNPDPLWQDAYNAILLLQHDLGEAAVLLRDLLGYDPVDRSGSSEIPSAKEQGQH